MIIYCKDRGFCQVDVLVCLYLCRKSSKSKCKEYSDNYGSIQEMVVEQKYVDRYGEPDITPPKQPRRKKEKERLKKVKLTKKPEAIPAAEATKPKKKKKEESVKPKRKRRTKAEMEAARNEEEKPKGGRKRVNKSKV